MLMQERHHCVRPACRVRSPAEANRENNSAAIVGMRTNPSNVAAEACLGRSTSRRFSILSVSNEENPARKICAKHVRATTIRQLAHFCAATRSLR
jgi:hypothetical protein